MDKIKHTMFINLDNRKDRLVHVTKQLKSIGLNDDKFSRFPAVNLPNGRLGCSMSHLKCIQTAKQRRWENVFICEDDITFTKPELFTQQVEKFFNSDKVKNWDVCIVAGNNVPPYEKVDDFCIKVSHCQTTTGYIVNENYYDTLIQNYREGIKRLIENPERHVHYAIDKHWITLQRKDKWFLIVPASVIQMEDFSDIEQKVVNYNWHMLDIDKTEFLEQRRAQMAMLTKYSS
tara:strand:+ start:11257 stop:11952 length:696 start_codon:yes stop_codon:yes gene_type:complete